MYQALYRSFRPQDFDDVVGQKHITETLKRQVEGERLSHAYLFTGTRGTGKTSCAKILAKAVNCENPQNGNPCNACPSCKGIDAGSILDVLELDAATNNGVDQVRALRDEAIFTPAAVKKRVYIVDEVHMLSVAAFNALLKILEEPPAHLMFILATTELHKVPATIKSRCQQYAFKRILPLDIVARLTWVGKQEGITLTEGGAALLARLAEGGLRDALSLMDQCLGEADLLTEESILDTLGLVGNVEMEKLLRSIVASDTKTALESVGRFYHEGKDMGALLSELSVLLRDILLMKTAGNGGASLRSASYSDELLKSFSLTGAELMQMLGIVQHSIAELYRSSNRRTDVELCIIRLSEKSLSEDMASLLARISVLEAKVKEGIAPVIVEKIVDKVPASVVQNSKRETSPVIEEKAAPQIEEVHEEEDMPPWLEEDMPAPWDDEPPMTEEEYWSGGGDFIPVPEIPTETVVETPVVPTKTVEVPREVPREVPVEAPVIPQPVAEASPVATGGGEDWNGFVVKLRGKVPPQIHAIFRNKALARGVFSDKELRIYVDSDMNRTMVNKSEVLDSLQEVALLYTGRMLTVHIEIDTGTAVEEPSGNSDKFGDLLQFGKQFGNITIK